MSGVEVLNTRGLLVPKRECAGVTVSIRMLLKGPVEALGSYYGPIKDLLGSVSFWVSHKY